MNRPFLCLLDSGATGCWISSTRLPPNIQGKTVAEVTSQTLAGTFTSNQEIQLEQVMLPEFFKTRRIDLVQAKIFTTPCRYDMILGRDLLNDLGIILDFKNKSMEWDQAQIPMRSYPGDQDNATTATEWLLDAVDNDLVDNDETLTRVSDTAPHQVNETNYQEKDVDPDGYKSKTIRASLYEQSDLQEIVDKCTYLTQAQQHQLFLLLSKFPKLFDGKLKTFNGPPIHLELIDNPTPVRSRAYPIPRSQLQVFKQELDRLVHIGVLERAKRSEWIAGTFITAKKDGRVRWITDFRGLNRSLKRRVYPLRRISDIITRHPRYKYFTKLDISMQYYTFVLDEPSRDLCTFATPFGLYRYCRLPMGVSESPDISTEIMTQVLDGLDVDFYMDDIAILNQTWDEHVQLVEQVLQRLESAGFTINPTKCEWAVEETDFLGHWMTPDGIKPWRRKVEAILKMKPPTNIKELRSFLGLVNYYRDMWPRRTHILAPLMAMTGKTPFTWDATHQHAFDTMKSIVAADALLAYPDPNQPFDVETDASDYQLGAVIKQHGRPVAYYSRKLNSAQRNYTTIEKELLSIVETLREFRGILLGSDVRVYTDHQNLTHKLTSFTTQRVLRWRLLLEEFRPTFRYKQGVTNFIADALSRVPTALTERESTRTDVREKQAKQHQLSAPDIHLLDAFLEHPVFDEEGRVPIQFSTIYEYQQNDQKVPQLPIEKPEGYQYKTLGGFPIICTAGEHSKMVLTDVMLPKAVKWFHEATAHNAGISRLDEHLKFHFFHPRLSAEVRDQVSKCDLCQRMKRGARQYGLLSSRDAAAPPWHDVALDCIGPWAINLRGGKQFKILALTTMDTATNLLEIEPLRTKTASECARAFDNGWLARYPRPVRVIHDQGSEFTGSAFQDLLARAGIKSSPATSRNPQGNSVIEAVHKSVGQVLRTLVHLHNPQSVAQADQLSKDALATAMHATRCASHQALHNMTPGSLAFRRDMLFDIPFLTDFIALKHSRQAVVDKRVQLANAHRLRHEFRLQDQVLKKSVLSHSDKLAPSFTGPFEVIQVHTNGTCTIRLSPNQTERINIRRLKPYKS